MQLFSVQEHAPALELPLNVQLLSVQEPAPTPALPLTVQLINEPPDAPPAELPVSVQLDTTALADSQNTPPHAHPPGTAPFVSVKPISAAPFVRYTHRTAASPYGMPGG